MTKLYFPVSVGLRSIEVASALTSRCIDSGTFLSWAFDVTQFPGSFDELERRRRILRLSTLVQLCYVALAAFGIRRLELLVNLLNLVNVWAHSITKLRRFINNWCWIITYRFCALGSVCVRLLFQILRVYTEILCHREPGKQTITP